MDGNIHHVYVLIFAFTNRVKVPLPHIRAPRHQKPHRPLCRQCILDDGQHVNIEASVRPS